MKKGRTEGRNGKGESEGSREGPRMGRRRKEDIYMHIYYIDIDT
jgi:hypothetical protein